MKKKRLIFSLFYEDGHFVQSRNFRRQRVGDVSWLRQTYGFSTISTSVDELIIVDISSNHSKSSQQQFLKDAATIAEMFFAPIAIGGNVVSLDDARRALAIGAEKIVVNTALFKSPDQVAEIVNALGSQAVVGSVDLRRQEDSYAAYVCNGTEVVPFEVSSYLQGVIDLGVGELLLGSIDKDGTGMGFDLNILDLVPTSCEVPIVMMGGAGTVDHLKVPLALPSVDGVATGNLFNFVGNGLPDARASLLASGQPLASFIEVMTP